MSRLLRGRPAEFSLSPHRDLPWLATPAVLLCNGERGETRERWEREKGVGDENAWMDENNRRDKDTVLCKKKALTGSELPCSMLKNNIVIHSSIF